MLHINYSRFCLRSAAADFFATWVANFAFATDTALRAVALATGFTDYLLFFARAAALRGTAFVTLCTRATVATATSIAKA